MVAWKASEARDDLRPALLPGASKCSFLEVLMYFLQIVIPSLSLTMLYFYRVFSKGNVDMHL